MRESSSQFRLCRLELDSMIRGFIHQLVLFEQDSFDRPLLHVVVDVFPAIVAEEAPVAESSSGH